MARENFSRFVKDALALNATFRCVRPGCGRPTHAFDEVKQRVQNVGAASHDAGASAKGPRGNIELTPAQSRAYNNGAWLCRHCATVVDEFVENFGPGVISGWQTVATAANRSNVQRPAIPSSMMDGKAACSGAKEFCKRLDSLRLERPGGDIIGVSVKTLSLMRSLARECFLFGPLNPLSSLYPHTVNKQTRILEALKIIEDEITNFNVWYASQDHDQIFWPRSVQPLDHSGRKVCAMWNDVLSQKTELQIFANHGTLEQPDMLFGW